MKATATGYWTPEFIVTVLVDIVAAIVGILATRGLLNPQEGELWIVLARALAVPISLLVIGWTTARFTAKQAEVRTALISRGLSGTE